MSERCTNPGHDDPKHRNTFWQCPDCTTYHVCVADDCCTWSERMDRRTEVDARTAKANAARAQPTSAKAAPVKLTVAPVKLTVAPVKRRRSL